MKKTRPYKKHVYWLTENEEARLRDELAARNIKLRSAKGVVCTPLDQINKISSVAPEVWNETCGRKGSWYRSSEKKGLYLVVSSFELENYREQKAGTIIESDFVPPQLATLEDKKALFQDTVLKKRVPGEWKNAQEVEKRLYLRWAKKLGSDTEDFAFLHLSHTANHANFLTPRFFITDQSGIIPYSIDRSAHLCSCCVELFQIIGAEYKKKLVAPCPGACIYARLRPDRYLLVEKT